MVQGVSPLSSLADNKSSVTADADAGGRHHSLVCVEIGATFILVCVHVPRYVEAMLGWRAVSVRRMD